MKPSIALHHSLDQGLQRLTFFNQELLQTRGNAFHSEISETCKFSIEVKPKSGFLNITPPQFSIFNSHMAGALGSEDSATDIHKSRVLSRKGGRLVSPQLAWDRNG